MGKRKEREEEQFDVSMEREGKRERRSEPVTIGDSNSSLLSGNKSEEAQEERARRFKALKRKVLKEIIEARAKVDGLVELIAILEANRRGESTQRQPIVNKVEEIETLESLESQESLESATLP